MYTQCPECESAFRVTAEVLKKAAGMVRCGSCGHAFNSLEFLSEQKPERHQPAPDIPELRPEPAEEERALSRKSMSAEQSAALLKTLDQLAGEDIRIEDTGVEWRVLDNDLDDDPGPVDDETLVDDAEITNAYNLDADDAVDANGDNDPEGSGLWLFEEPASDGPDRTGDPGAGETADAHAGTVVEDAALFDDRQTDIDEVLDGNATPVDELLDARPAEVQHADVFEPATEEMRFDDNTPLPDDYLEDDATPTVAPPATAETTAGHAGESLAAATGNNEADWQASLTLGDPDEWQQLLSDFDDLLTNDLQSSQSSQSSPSADDPDERVAPTAVTNQDDATEAGDDAHDEAPHDEAAAKPLAVDADSDGDSDAGSDGDADSDSDGEELEHALDAASRLTESLNEPLDDALDASRDDVLDASREEPQDELPAGEAEAPSGEDMQADEAPPGDPDEDADADAGPEAVEALDGRADAAHELFGESDEDAADDAADDLPVDEDGLDLSGILNPDDDALHDDEAEAAAHDDDDLPELKDVGADSASGPTEHEIPPETEEEQTINRLIDQDLLAIAHQDEDGFASTIVFEALDGNAQVETVVIGDADEDEDGAGADQARDDDGIDAGPDAGNDHDDESLSLAAGGDEARASGQANANRPRWLAAGVAALAVALALQAIHQQRENLATNPTLMGLLGPLYSALGMPLNPNYDVSGWDIARTQGATDEQDRLLTIVSEIRNTSDAALPYPVVTLSLTDRYQDPIGALVMKPSDYLAENRPADELVEPGATFEAVIPIGEPSPDAVGYTINACYRTPNGNLRCAVDDFK